PAPRPTTIPLARTGDEKLDALLARGDEAFEAGDYAAAAKEYEAARKAAPKRAAGLVGIARTKISKASPSLGYGSSEKSAGVKAGARDLRRAASLEPGFGPAHVELGRALLLLGDAAGAESALRKGAAALPDEPEARSSLGVALLAVGKTEEAL